jgi:tripartite-type tricarboxylate transporter receptor subunit TctC
MQRRTLLRAAGAGLAACAPGVALAQAYPARAITLIVPYAAGGNADLTARLFADALSKAANQSVVVDNRGGGGGAIGAAYVIASRPDGYTLLFSAPSVFSVTPHLAKVNYGIASIRPVALVSKTPIVLVARKAGKYKSLADLVQAAKAGPGAVAMGYSGLGTPNHLAMLNLESITQARFNGIAYKGSGPMLQDMLAGQIDVGADQITSSRPYLESGDLIALAVFGSRLDSLPGVPAVSTLGPEPFDVTTYLGLAAPAATPDAIVASIQKAAAKAIEDERFKAGMAKMGAFVQGGGGQDYERLMRAENDFVVKMLASGRVQPE